MKRFLKIALIVYFVLSLTFGLLACTGKKRPPANNGDNGQEQTTPTDDNGSESVNNSGDEKLIVETGDNELPLIPFE